MNVSLAALASGEHDFLADGAFFLHCRGQNGLALFPVKKRGHVLSVILLWLAFMFQHFNQTLVAVNEDLIGIRDNEWSDHAAHHPFGQAELSFEMNQHVHQCLLTLAYQTGVCDPIESPAILSIAKGLSTGEVAFEH